MCALSEMSSIGVQPTDREPNLRNAARLSLSGQLMTSILHEMYQPLVAAGLRARNGRDLLDAGGSSPEALRAIFEDIEGCLSFAIDIGQRLRCLSDNRPLELAPLDLNDTLRQVDRKSVV